jgi:hypothetical protein
LLPNNPVNMDARASAVLGMALRARPRAVALAVLIVSVSLAAATAADQLIRREVNQNNPGGKDLVMTFEELRRDEKTSLAKVVHRSGASVASAMFVVRGFYDVSKARGFKYFVNLKEWDAPEGGRMYLVGFSNDKNVSIPTYFGFSEPPSVPDRHQFLAVEDYARLFEGHK